MPGPVRPKALKFSAKAPSFAAKAKRPGGGRPKRTAAQMASLRQGGGGKYAVSNAPLPD